MLTRRELLAGAAALSTASRLLASKSHITKAHISAITDEIGLTQADAIAFAHEYGLEWVELRNVPETKKEFTFLTEPELKRWAAELATSKLKVSFLNTSLLKFTWPGLEPPKRRPESDEQRTTRVAHEKQLWENRKEDVTKAVLAANILGCDRIRVFTGERVAQPETTYKMIVQTMEELIPIAEKGKVHLVIENENTQNIGTSAETRDIMQLLPSKTIGFNWDPGNSITLKEVPWPDGYRLLPINRMLNVQFKAKNVMDNNNEPIDWKSIMEAMQKDGYQGRLGLETHMGLGPERIKNAHASMRNILHMVGELPDRMSKAFGIAFAAAILVIGFLIWRGFVDTKGNHLEPTGKIGKVREMKVDDNEIIVLLDFNVRNDSDVAMVVRGMEASLDAADGSKVDGHMISAPDLPNFFRNYPAIGEQYNPPLKVRDRIGAHETVDRMVGVRFDVPEETVLNRRDVILRIEDITGPVAELKGK